MIQRSDLRLLIGALVALVIVSIILVSWEQTDSVPFSVRSDENDGAMALRLWLERSGYDVREVLTTPNQLDDIEVLFLLNPLMFTFSPQDGERLRAWVEDGHTLILAGWTLEYSPFPEAFGISLQSLPYTSFTSTELGAPTLLSPPFEHINLRPTRRIDTEREDVIPHVRYAGNPVLVSFPQGNGEVWLTEAVYPFSNEGLQQPGSGELIANMLAAAPPGATIGFDERGHGFTQNFNTFNEWLFGTAPGWGVLLLVVVTMVYLSLRGRRFGRAVPLPEDRLRREPVEYIQAMATLFRRTGQREEMLKHYHDQLRRRLSERYGVDPKLENAELVKRVVYADPSVDEAALRELLSKLSRGRVSEPDLIRAAADVDAYLREHG